MAAIFVEEAHCPAAVAEGDEALSEKLDMDGIAAGLGKLRAEADGRPEAPHRLAHRRARADPAHEFVVFEGNHGAPP
jgi:hypothetical protein